MVSSRRRQVTISATFAWSMPAASMFSAIGFSVAHLLLEFLPAARLACLPIALAMPSIAACLITGGVGIELLQGRTAGLEGGAGIAGIFTALNARAAALAQLPEGPRPLQILGGLAELRRDALRNEIRDRRDLLADDLGDHLGPRRAC